MGTRSLTYVYDDNSPILCLYRQMDGYPKGGHGEDLATFLSPFSIVNGFGFGDEAGTHANGMGCLAAQLVAHFKTGIGGFYIMSPTTTDARQEYEYHVWESRIQVLEMQYPSGKKVLFDGTWKAFSDWIKQPEEPEEEEDVLRVLLAGRPIQVVFTKGDGSERSMNCTQNPLFIPADKLPNSSSGSKDKNLFRVYDLQVGDWRSFRRERVKSYKVI